MLESVDYLTLLQYSPRGTSEAAIKSRKIKDQVKAGRVGAFQLAILDIINRNSEIISPFLNKDITLVPAPRSSPIRDTDLWPALEICKLLEILGYGTIATCLTRKYAIPKSSLIYNSEQRPSILNQYNSMEVSDYLPTKNITLVDDVLTIGRTSVAGALRLNEKFPNATVRTFSLIQTRGLVQDIDIIRNVITGIVSYNIISGKCTREP